MLTTAGRSRPRPELRQEVYVTALKAPASQDTTCPVYMVTHASVQRADAVRVRLQFDRYPALVGYVERILQSAFATPLPPAPPITAAAWGARAEPGNGSAYSHRCVHLALLAPPARIAVHKANVIWPASLAGVLSAYISNTQEDCRVKRVDLQAGAAPACIL